MNNDWIQITYVSGDVEVINTDCLLYMIKNSEGTRKMILVYPLQSFVLAGGDTVSSKTQEQVETFLGGPFVKIAETSYTLFVPVKSLSAIKKIGAVIYVKRKDRKEFESTAVILTDETVLDSEFN